MSGVHGKFRDMPTPPTQPTDTLPFNVARDLVAVRVAQLLHLVENDPAISASERNAAQHMLTSMEDNITQYKTAPWQIVAGTNPLVIIEDVIVAGDVA